MADFIISCDSCADLFKDYLTENNVHCIVMKRVQNGNEIGVIFNSEDEVDAFYDEIKKGALPTTIALNPVELKEHFEKILENEKGDIIHLTLSSGLSCTFENAVKAAEELNKTLSDRKIHVIDSLIATGGIAFLVKNLVEMRNKGIKTEDAVQEIQHLRGHLQSWIIVDDLKHLRRGGRISGFRAMVGTMLDIKPIIVMSKTGKLVIENKQRGYQKSIAYVLKKIEQYGLGSNFNGTQMYIYQTSRHEMTNILKKSILAKYPGANIEICRIGTIIGTHLGDGAVALLFVGAPRLDIS